MNQHPERADHPSAWSISSKAARRLPTHGFTGDDNAFYGLGRRSRPGSESAITDISYQREPFGQQEIEDIDRQGFEVAFRLTATSLALQMSVSSGTQSSSPSLSISSAIFSTSVTDMHLQWF